MAKSTKSTAPVAPVATTEQASAPAPAPVLKHNGKPVTHNDVWQFVQKHAGGNPANVRIVPLANVNREAPRPLPFAAMDKAGKRSTILWALVNGTLLKGGERTDRLSAFRQLAIANGASGSKLDDLLAAMNGGFSASSKSYGTGFVQLEVVAPAPAPAV